jgi:hypothetical protein
MSEGDVTSIAISSIVSTNDDSTPLLPIKLAGRFMPGRDGSPAHSSSVIRAITVGRKLRDGSRLRLQALRSGGAWLTRRTWIEQYLRAVADDRINAVTAKMGDEAARSTTANRSESDRRKAADAAMRELADLGV